MLEVMNEGRNIELNTLGVAESSRVWVRDLDWLWRLGRIKGLDVKRSFLFEFELERTR